MVKKKVKLVILNLSRQSMLTGHGEETMIIAWSTNLERH